MKIKRLLHIACAAILSSSALLFINIPAVFAAGPYTCTWTGGGGNLNFSTAGNWSGCNSAAPQASDNDTLIFDNTSLSSITIPNNDISSLVVNNIQFTGTNPTFGYSLSGNSFTLNGNITDSTSVFNSISNTLILSGSHTFSSATQTSFQSLQGSGTLIATGGGIVSFDCAGDCQTLTSYSGAISSTDSTIELSTFNTFTSSASVAVSGAAVLDLLDDNGGKSAVTDTYNLPVSLGGNGISKLGPLNLNGGQDSDVTNVLAGAVTLTTDVQVTASGSNTLNMTGAITYNGHSISSVGQNVTTITVPNGSNQSGQNPTVGSNVTFVVDGTVGNVTVADSGTLKGAGGTVGNLSLNSGGTVSPGHSPGCLNVGGNLSGGGTYQEQIQSPGLTACTDYDQINVSGTVNLTGSSLNTVLLGGFVPSVGRSFEIINNQGAGAVTGTFTNMPEGSTFNVGSTVFKVSYKGGDGNDVVLSVVSVPATPNTGFGLLSANPVLTVLATTLLAGGIFAIAERTRKAPVRVRR